MTVSTSEVELSDKVDCPSCDWSGRAGAADLYDDYVKCPECNSLVRRDE